MVNEQGLIHKVCHVGGEGGLSLIVAFSDFGGGGDLPDRYVTIKTETKAIAEPCSKHVLSLKQFYHYSDPNPWGITGKSGEDLNTVTYHDMEKERKSREPL